MSHDDVIRWKPFFAQTGLLCGEFTGEFPSQRPVTRSFGVSLICAWINAWIIIISNNRPNKQSTHYHILHRKLMLPLSSYSYMHDITLYLCRMMTSSNGNIFRVTCLLCGEFPSQRSVTRSLNVFFDLRLNKRLSKQSWGWLFEIPLRSLWRHCNGQRYGLYTTK